MAAHSTVQRGANPVAKLIAAGWQHTVLASDSGFYGFGTGANGELGHELGFVKFAAVKLKLPLAPPIEKGATQVAVGSKHTLILTDGDVFSTGSPDDGRLGHTDLHGVVPLPEKIRFIACGSDHSVAISKTGLNLYAWGLCGKYGEGLAADDGVEMKREARLTPSLFRIIEPLSRTAKLVEQIACGSQHTIALCEDGQVYSWGCGKHGRLGHGGVADYAEPKLVSRFVLSPEQSIVQVAAGDSHSMALDKEGRVFSWGSGSYGRLGSGQELDQYVPTQVQGKLKGVYAISISCNAFHSLAVTRASGSKASNVTLYTWGGGKYGKLGLDSERNQLSPQAVIFQGHNRQVIKAVCGLHHTVCVMQDSSVYAFGYGGGSRCGVEVDDLVVKTPREINFLRDAGIYKRYQLPKGDAMMKKYSASMVTAGEAHTLTLADKGDVVLAWGDNSSGQLGCGQMESSARPIPVFSAFASSPVIAVACGSAFSMALTKIGAVWTWGNNKEGQLGLGDTENRSTPELVKALQGTFINAIAAGHFHSSAVQYGFNFEGREIGAPSATTIPEADRKNNKIYVWGQNTEGQLGIGKEAVLRQLFPAPLQLKEKWDRVEMALGRTHSLVLGKDFEDGDVQRVERSKVYACGKGVSGQLGLVADLGQKHYRPAPIEKWESDTKKKTTASAATDEKGDSKTATPIQPPVKIRSVAAGESSSMAVEYDSDTEILWAWGTVPGLWESQRLAPTEIKHLMPASRFVGTAMKSTLEQELDAKKPIYKLRIPQVSCGKTHFMALVNYNNDNNVVFTWGDTRYGKLGHGQVPEFHEQRAAARKKIAGADEKLAGDDENKDSNLIGPAVIQAFASQDISQVSCFADHSLALSSKEGAELEGSVWSWGYGAAGRLGLDDATSKSEMRPRVIPFFGKTLGLMAAGDDSKSEDGPAPAIGPDGVALSPRDAERSTEVEIKEKRDARRQQELEDEPIVFSEEDDRKARAANLEAEKPLEQHRKHSIRYLELLSKLERQKMLVFKAIVRRVDASQGKRSLTQRKRKALKKNKEFVQKSREKEAQEKQRTILAEGGPGAEEKAAAVAELGIKHSFMPGYAGGHSEIREDEKAAESGFARGLSDMELLLTRLYMRPCFMFTVFNLYGEHIAKLKSNKVVPGDPKIPSNRRTDISQALMDDFSDLLVNVWDLWTDTDIRLTQTFLRMVFAQHVNDRIEEVLSPTSLEWAIMIRIMKSGRVWSKLSQLCNSLLDEMPAWDGDTPAKRLQSFQDNRNLDELNQALKHIHEHGEKLIQALQKPERRSQMIEAVGWCTEVFYEAIEKGGQHPIALYGRRVIALIIEFMIENHGRRRRMKDRGKIDALRKEAKKKGANTDARTNKTIDQLVKMKQAAGSELLVLYHLKQRAHSTDAIRSEVLKEFMIEQYGIDPAALGFTTDDETGELKTAAGDDVPVLPFPEEDLAPWTKQVTELLKSRKSFDPRLGVHDMEKVDAEQELFKDFLLMRSRQKRRIIRITESTKNLLDDYKLYITDINPEKPRKVVRMLGHFKKLNYQVDPFAADFKTGVDAKLVNASQCVKCGLLHAPLVSYERHNEDEEKGGERKEDERKGVKETKTVILVEAECLTLYQAIKGQKYRKHLQNTSGEETWRALLDQLQEHRASYMKLGQFEKAHVYEKAFSTMRKLKDKRDDKRVLTNLVFGENSAVPVTCKADDLTPIFLMKTLEELNNADQKMKRLAGRKVENISKVVKQLEEEVFDAYDMFDDMKKQYRKVTAATERSLKELGIPKAKIERVQELAYLAKLRPQNEVKVHLDQGVVKRHKYKDLVDAKILLPNDRDPSREGWMPFACFRCLRCCLDPPDQQQIQFLAGVTFVFSTTDTDGVYSLNLGYQAKAASSSLLTVNVALQELRDKDEDEDPDYPKPFNMRYDPTGDNVPVQKRQIFRFAKQELLCLLQSLPIPVRKFTLDPAPPA